MDKLQEFVILSYPRWKTYLIPEALGCFWVDVSGNRNKKKEEEDKYSAVVGRKQSKKKEEEAQV